MENKESINDQEEAVNEAIDDVSAVEEEDVSLKTEEANDSSTEILTIRGPKFRKTLLKRIQDFSYTDPLGKQDLDLDALLSPLLGLKADVFINQLKKIIPKEES